MEFIKQALGAPVPIGPYSAAVQVNGLLFCSGQIGIDPDTGALAEGGIDSQTRQVLNNLRAVLASRNMKFDDVALTTVFLSDMAFAKRFNELYAEVVSKETPPARQTVAVKELPLGALIEISLIAS